MPLLFIQFLLWILVGSFAGWLTGRSMKGYGYGPLMDVAMGTAGAAAGGLIVGFPAFPGPLGMMVTVLGSILGAIALSAATALASGERRYA